MKMFEVHWDEPDKFPAMKSMKCEGCGWPVTAAWASLDTGVFTLMADSPKAKGKFNPVDECPGCGNRLALYTMDMADDGAWHYVS